MLILKTGYEINLSINQFQIKLNTNIHERIKERKNQAKTSHEKV